MKGLQLPACRSTDWEDGLGLACEELLAPSYGLARPAKANHLRVGNPVTPKWFGMEQGPGLGELPTSPWATWYSVP